MLLTSDASVFSLHEIWEASEVSNIHRVLMVGGAPLLSRMWRLMSVRAKFRPMIAGVEWRLMLTTAGWRLIGARVEFRLMVTTVE